jgi:hypothetical protein
MKYSQNNYIYVFFSIGVLIFNWSCTHKNKLKISKSQENNASHEFGLQPHTIIKLDTSKWYVQSEFSNSVWNTESVSIKNKKDTGTYILVSSISQYFGKSREFIKEKIALTVEKKAIENDTIIRPLLIDSIEVDSFNGFYFISKNPKTTTNSYALTISGYCFNGLGLTEIFMFNPINDTLEGTINNKLSIMLKFINSIITYSALDIKIENERIKTKYEIMVEELPLDSIYYSWSTFTEEGDTVEYYSNDRSKVPEYLLNHPFLGRKTFCGRLLFNPNLELKPIRIEVNTPEKGSTEIFKIIEGNLMITSTEMRRTTVIKTGNLIVLNKLGLESSIPFTFAFNPSLKKF